VNKIVIVTWFDTEDKLEWKSLKEVKKYKCPIIYSVGWLIEDTNEHIKICLHDSEGNSEDDCEREVSTVSTIPRGMVKEVKTIWTKK
jgi:hypothetical protein